MKSKLIKAEWRRTVKKGGAAPGLQFADGYFSQCVRVPRLRQRMAADAQKLHGPGHLASTERLASAKKNKCRRMMAVGEDEAVFGRPVCHRCRQCGRSHIKVTYICTPATAMRGSDQQQAAGIVDCSAAPLKAP